MDSMSATSGSVPVQRNDDRCLWAWLTVRSAPSQRFSGSAAAGAAGNLPFAGSNSQSCACGAGLWQAGMAPGRVWEQLPSGTAAGQVRRPGSGAAIPLSCPGPTSGDMKELLGQMSYIKWQVINSRWQFQTAVFLLVINSSGAWGGA